MMTAKQRELAMAIAAAMNIRDVVARSKRFEIVFDTNKGMQVTVTRQVTDVEPLTDALPEVSVIFVGAG